MTEDYYQQVWKQSHYGCGSMMTVAFIIVVMLALLTGCKTQYVPVPEYHTEYIVKHDSVTLRDSIWQHDSIYVEKSGDTILMEKWRTKYQLVYRDVLRVDSFVKTDSVRVPYPVERKLNKWEQFKMDYGAVSFGVSIAAIIAAIVALVLWLRKRSLLR